MVIEYQVLNSWYLRSQKPQGKLKSTLAALDPFSEPEVGGDKYILWTDHLHLPSIDIPISQGVKKIM